PSSPCATSTRPSSSPPTATPRTPTRWERASARSGSSPTLEVTADGHGNGRALGAALNALLRDFGVEPMRRLSTYHAKHWHAQLSQLTNTQRGWEASSEPG